MKYNREEMDNRKSTERLNLNKFSNDNSKTNSTKLLKNMVGGEDGYEKNKISIYKSNNINKIGNITNKVFKKIVISEIIDGIKKHNNCINFYLENTFSNRNNISDFWDLFNSNAKIELFYEESKNQIHFYCKWCKDNCNNNLQFKSIEKDIIFPFLNKKFKICNCKKIHKEENPNINQKINEFNDLKNDIEKTKFINNLFFVQNFVSYHDINDFELKKEYNFSNFIIFSPVTNQKFEIIKNYIELKFKYNSDIFQNIFSNFDQLNQLNKIDFKEFNIDLIHNFCEFYFQKYFLKDLKTNEISLLDLIEENLNPGDFSFSFEINKKNRIVNTLIKNNYITFFYKCGISYEQFYKINFINKKIYYDLITFCLFSNNFCNILNNMYKGFLIPRDCNSKFMNHIYMIEIFNDFMVNGKLNVLSFFDKENAVSRINLRRLLLILLMKDNNKKLQTFIGIMDYFDFKNMFLDNSKERILVFLSSYIYSKNKTILEDNDFNLKREIKEILNIKKEKKGYQNSYITTKLLKYLKITLFDIDYTSMKNYYCFTDLVNKIIHMNLLEKMLTDFLNETLEANKLIDILKLATLCCINDIGIDYLYNSCLLDKILRIIIFIIKSPKKYENIDKIKDKTIKSMIDDNSINIESIEEEGEVNLQEIFIELIINLTLTFKNEELVFKLQKLNFDSLPKNKYYYILKLLIFEQNINNIFDGDNYLLFRINLLFHLLEKNNNDLIFNSFSESKIDDPYSDIIAKKLLNLEIDNKIEQIFDKETKYEEINDVNFKKKYLEPYIDMNKNAKSKKLFKSYYIIFILQTLKLLDNCFFLGYDKYRKLFNKEIISFNKNFDLINLIKNENIPFSVKSLLLNFLFIFVLAPSKVSNENNNKVFWALTYDNLDSKELKGHLSNALILMDVCTSLIDIILSREIHPDASYIKKDGIYDISVTIIRAIYCFCNLILNTINIHKLYICGFLNLLIKFYSNIDFFMDITNIKEKKDLDNRNRNNDIQIMIEKIAEQNKIEEDNEENIISLLIEVHKEIKTIIDNINSDFYNIINVKVISIYDKYINYFQKLSSFSNDCYSYLFQKENINITLEDLNPDINLENLNEEDFEKAQIYSETLKNYNLWLNHVEENNDKGLDFFLKNIDINRNKLTLRHMFYYSLYRMIVDEDIFLLNNVAVLNSIIKLILSDKKYNTILDMNSIKVYYENETEDSINEIFEKLIGKLIKTIYLIFNYEFMISKTFNNSKNENNISEFLNTLIIFFELLGENSQTFFHKYIFEYKYNLNDLKDFHAIEKFTNIENFKSNNSFNTSKITPFETLLMLFIQQLNSFDLFSEILMDNSLIIFNSLTQCILEYSSPEKEIHKQIIGYDLSIYFSNTRDFERKNFFNNEDKMDRLKSEKNIFIIRNYSLMNVFCAKMAQGYFGVANVFYHDILQMYNFFKEILDELQIDLSDNIKSEEKKLLNNYKNQKITTPLLGILALYYEKIYYLDKIQGFHSFNVLITFADDKMNELDLIIDFIQDFLSKTLKKSTVIIMFSFLGKIVNTIEIILKEKKLDLVYHVQPEVFKLSKESINYYKKHVDRSSRDSKLLSIYDNIDSFLFEIIYNSHINYNKLFLFQFKEGINILFFFVENIYLVIFYYKSIKKSFEEYNEVQEEKESNVLLIISIVHIAYLFAVLIEWIYSKLKINYFYSLSKYNMKNLEDEKKLSLGDKAERFKKLSSNFSPSFGKINGFFKNISGKKKFFIFFKDTLISNSQIIQYIFSFICLILFMFFSQIFLTFPLLLCAMYFITLHDIFKAIINKLFQIISLYYYSFLILYIFSFVGLFYLPKMFKYEVVDKNNEIIDENYLEENICSSSLQCILYFFNYGFSENSIDMNLISFKTDTGYYLRQFFFQIFLTLFVSRIFSNIFYAIITDAFSEMREISTINEEDMQKICFICQITRNDCMIEHIDFLKHIKEHKVEKYIKFICNIILKNETNLTYEEYYVYEMIKDRKFDWFPLHKEEETQIEANN